VTCSTWRFEWNGLGIIAECSCAINRLADRWRHGGPALGCYVAEAAAAAAAIAPSAAAAAAAAAAASGFAAGRPLADRLDAVPAGPASSLGRRRVKYINRLCVRVQVRSRLVALSLARLKWRQQTALPSCRRLNASSRVSIVLRRRSV